MLQRSRVARLVGGAAGFLLLTIGMCHMANASESVFAATPASSVTALPDGLVVSLQAETSLTSGDTFSYEVSASIGWEATIVSDGVESLLNRSIQTVDDQGEIPLLQAELHPSGSYPDDEFVVVTFTLFDEDGGTPPERLRVHLRQRRGAFELSTAEEYFEAANVGTPTEPAFVGGFVDPTPMTELPLEAREQARAFEQQAALPEAGTRSVARAVSSYLGFWDIRGIGSDTPVGRYEECIPGDETCDLGDYRCCYRPLPRVKVVLVRGSMYGGTEVATGWTSESGHFFLADPDWQGGDYHLRVYMERSGYPSSMAITFMDSSTPIRLYVADSFQLTQTITTISQMLVNIAPDPDSIPGDLASLWTTAHDTHSAIDEEDETRHRMLLGSPNSYDPYAIHYYYTGLGSESSCPSDVDIHADRARQPAYFAENLGRLYHCRVIGQTNGVPVFPAREGCSDGDAVSEHTSLFNAIPKLIWYITRFDPDTAVFSSSQPQVCVSTASNPYTNDCASDINNAKALWEFIDTSTANADFWADFVDVTLADLMDGLVAWHDDDSCSSGDQHTECEFYFTDTGLSCPSKPCAGDTQDRACCNGACMAGDPNGGNIRDWMHHLAAVMGAAEYLYVMTLESSACVGPGRTSAPWDGGYHLD